MLLGFSSSSFESFEYNQHATAATNDISKERDKQPYKVLPRAKINDITGFICITPFEYPTSEIEEHTSEHTKKELPSCSSFFIPPGRRA
jgi:hypothetical protein